MVVQHLGGPTQPVVDHELYASQHTGEEEIHEVKDGGGIHVAFFLSFSPGDKLDQIRARHGPDESFSSFHCSVTRVPVTLEGGKIPAFDVPVRVSPSMVTSKVRVKRNRVFMALLHILWEQTEAITQPWSNLGGVRNELLELCQETIHLAFREPPSHALLEVLHRGNQRV